jgi:hypothetical protein
MATQNFVANWVWTIPNGSKMWNTGLGKALLDNWQLSGVATFQSGAPLGINYTLVNSVDITGSVTEPSRVNVIADPNLPADQRSFYRNFNTNAFAPPTVGTSGNANKVVIRGPGINDWDLALFRSFVFGRERARIQLRWETYNTFNHTQFSGLDNNARFDSTGKQVSQSFGSYTSAYDPRTMQVALKISF